MMTRSQKAPIAILGTDQKSAQSTKRALYITCHDPTVYGDGIGRKILEQIQAISESGYVVDIAQKTKAGGSLCCHENNSTLLFSAPAKYSFLYCLAKKLRRHDFYYDLVYIRNPHGGLYATLLPLLLKEIRDKSKTIVLEIPNYPYEKEAKSLKDKISIFSHKLIRRKLKKYLELIVYTGPKILKIWGVPALQIHNCCDPRSIPISEPGQRTWKTIKFIGVANLAPWHGYDRLLYGIKDYYKSNNRTFDIEFHVIGDTEPTMSDLKSLTTDLELHGHVFFHGRLGGEKLNSLFSGDVVGVDALGRHRSGNNYNDSLKSKEYCFRGIPFIKSHLDDSFPDNLDFVINIPSNESPADLAYIISKLKSMTSSTDQIRDFASRRFRWKEQFSRFMF